MNNKALLTYITIASIILIILSVYAHLYQFFPFDLEITRALQAHREGWIDALAKDISWPGYAPQFTGIVIIFLAVLTIVKLRFEALLGLLILFTTSLAGYIVKILVDRPRPNPNLVWVNDAYLENGQHSFTAGHVFTFVAIFGWLLYLSYIFTKRNSIKRAILILLNFIVLMMVGFSRIYLGDHWSSDVMGAYLLGSIFLTLGIIYYRFLKVHYSKSYRRINGQS